MITNEKGIITIFNNEDSKDIFQIHKFSDTYDNNNSKIAITPDD